MSAVRVHLLVWVSAVEASDGGRGGWRSDRYACGEPITDDTRGAGGGDPRVVTCRACRSGLRGGS